MDIDKAIEILEHLSEGVNPVTGEILPENDSCNQADVIRALYTVLNKLNSSKSKRAGPENAGKPWTDKETEQLKKEFSMGMSINSIAKAHCRSKGAVEVKLCRLGLIEETYFAKKIKEGY